MLETRRNFTAYLPLVPAPIYNNLPPIRSLSDIASMTIAMTGSTSETALETIASWSLISRHRSSVLTSSMFVVIGFLLSVGSDVRDGGTIDGLNILVLPKRNSFKLTGSERCDEGEEAEPQLEPESADMVWLFS